MEKKPMNIKMLAMDLDFTALNDEHKLSEGNRMALEAASEAGVNVVIATGRCFDALPKDVLGVEGIRYAITSNGAQITDMRENKVVYENCLDPEAVVELYPLLKQHQNKDVMIEIFYDGTAYIEEQVYHDILSGKVTSRVVEYIRETRNPMPQVLEKMVENKTRIENINLFFNTIEEKEAMYPVLKDVPNVTLTSSLDFNWEFGGATTSKADAMLKLGEQLGITKDEIMAFGDSPNDLDMMNAAGYAVAVANAKKEVLEMADYVTLSNDDDGVAAAIRKFGII